MSQSALRRRAREARQWLFEACFPLWADIGLTPAGLFPEFLTLAHTPAPHAQTRVRVQARQTYVFAEALRLGWQPVRSRRLVEAGASILAAAVIGPAGLPGRMLDSETARLSDAAPDLYDIAFTLFGLAEASDALGHAAPPLHTARRILHALDRLMRDPAGGYAEALPRPATRLQNPHMHLLEACLSLHRADPAGGHLGRAAELVALFETRFTAGTGGLLGETFSADWSAGPDGDEDAIEPGHQFEWVWLTDCYAGATGAALPAAASRLYAFAVSTLDSDGRAVQSVRRDGAIVDGSRRTWPQTEALKAHLVQFERTGEARAGLLACRSFDTLFDEYLTEDGGWIDHFSAEGSPIAATMPASTGYHVVLALSELIRRHCP